MRFFLAAAVLLTLAFPAAAQDWDCANPGELPQQGMNYCAAIDFEDADRALNVAWKMVKAEVDARDAEMPEGMGGWGDALLEAQRAWITYRDAHCVSEGYQFHGGSMEPFIVSSCKAHATRMRLQELLLLVESY